MVVTKYARSSGIDVFGYRAAANPIGTANNASDISRVAGRYGPRVITLGYIRVEVRVAFDQHGVMAKGAVAQDAYCLPTLPAALSNRHATVFLTSLIASDPDPPHLDVSKVRNCDF